MARRKSLSSTHTGTLSSNARGTSTSSVMTAAKAPPSSTSVGDGASNQKRRGKRVCCVTVDITACRYAVIKKCLRERGFRLIKTKESDAKPNYAVNKNSKHFQQASASDENKGSKRSLAAIMKHLDDTDQCSSQQVWTQICDIVVKTLLCIQPKLSSSYKSFFGENDAMWGPKCFEVLGFDIMLDASGKAWLFGVNHAPSFAGDSPLDREIKSALISSTLTLIAVTNEKKRAILKGDRLEWSKRLWKTQPAIHTKKIDPALKAAGSGSVQNQQIEVKPNDNTAAIDLLEHSDRPEEQDDVDGGSTAGDPGGQQGNSEDDNSGDSDPEDGSDDRDDIDEESGNNQSREQQTKVRSSGTPASATTEPPVKLPSIRNIFQKKNRVSPGNPEINLVPTQGPAMVTATGAVAATGISSNSSATQPPTSANTSVVITTDFTNEFVQIYPVVEHNTAAEGDLLGSSQRLLYEKIHAAAEVNKSNLWS